MRNFVVSGRSEGGRVAGATSRSESGSRQTRLEETESLGHAAGGQLRLEETRAQEQEDAQGYQE
jgi:hypothetical protein